MPGYLGFFFKWLFTYKILKFVLFFSNFTLLIFYITRGVIVFERPSEDDFKDFKSNLFFHLPTLSTKNGKLGLEAIRKDILKTSESNIKKIWERTNEQWNSFSSGINDVFSLWLFLYFAFIVIYGLENISIINIIIDNKWQALFFNTVNNFETILFVHALSFIISDWRTNNNDGLTFHPVLIVSSMIILIFADLTSKFFFNDLVNLSDVCDIISGITTGIVFFLLVSKLHNRLIDNNLVIIVLLALYACIMVLYPCINVFIGRLELLFNDATNKEVLSNISISLQFYKHVILIVLFFIALVGKICLGFLFLNPKFASRFFYFQLSNNLIGDKYNLNLRAYRTWVDSKTVKDPNGFWKSFNNTSN